MDGTIPILFHASSFQPDLSKTAITAAGVVPCGGRKKSPRTSSIVQIIFHFGPLRSVKIFRVFKTLAFRNILLHNFLIIDPI